MSTEDNKQIVRSFIERVYNQGDTAFVDEIVSPEFLRHGIGGTMHGPQIIKDRVMVTRAGFPDFKITIEDQIAEEDKVVTRQTHRGMHQGEFIGVAPTRITMETTETSILRVSDGHIQETWVSVDMLTLLQQIGAITLPGQ
jgi:predicted ester cyclase